MAEKGKQERKGGSERRGLGAVVCGGLRLFAVVGIGPSHKPQRALEKRRRWTGRETSRTKQKSMKLQFCFLAFFLLSISRRHHRRQPRRACCSAGAQRRTASRSARDLRDSGDKGARQGFEKRGDAGPRRRETPAAATATTKKRRRRRWPSSPKLHSSPAFLLSLLSPKLLTSSSPRASSSSRYSRPASRPAAEPPLRTLTWATRQARNAPNAMARRATTGGSAAARPSCMIG